MLSFLGDIGEMALGEVVCWFFYSDLQLYSLNFYFLPLRFFKLLASNLQASSKKKNFFSMEIVVRARTLLVAPSYDFST